MAPSSFPGLNETRLAFFLPNIHQSLMKQPVEDNQKMEDEEWEMKTTYPLFPQTSLKPIDTKQRHPCTWGELKCGSKVVNINKIFLFGC